MFTLAVVYATFKTDLRLKHWATPDREGSLFPRLQCMCTYWNVAFDMHLQSGGCRRRIFLSLMTFCVCSSGYSPSPWSRFCLRTWWACHSSTSCEIMTLKPVPASLKRSTTFAYFLRFSCPFIVISSLPLSPPHDQHHMSTIISAVTTVLLSSSLFVFMSMLTVVFFIPLSLKILLYLYLTITSIGISLSPWLIRNAFHCSALL